MLTYCVINLASNNTPLFDYKQVKFLFETCRLLFVHAHTIDKARVKPFFSPIRSLNLGVGVVVFLDEFLSKITLIPSDSPYLFLVAYVLIRNMSMFGVGSFVVLPQTFF